jgi:dolichol-phosphate mannosyltransferase
VSAVVVIPTYNEADNVRSVLNAVLAAKCQPDVLVVDDNSPDGTGAVVRSMMQAAPRLQLLGRPGKAGLGQAYVAGFRRALCHGDYEVVVQMDADESHDPTDVDRLVSALADADLVLGSRYIAGGSVEGWPWRRRILSTLGNRYARMWVGPLVRDWTGGFKAWRADLLREIGFDEVRSDGYAFQVEMTARAVAHGARILELPIAFRNRGRGVSKMDLGVAIEAVRVLPKLRRRESRRT